MTAMDGRVAAWMQAWERLDVADDFKRQALKNGADPEQPAPPYYWTLIAEADVFASLAMAPGDVGYIVGAQLEAKYRADQELEARRNAMLKRKHEAPLDPSCTCSFDESQCPIHNEGDEMENDDDVED